MEMTEETLSRLGALNKVMEDGIAKSMGKEGWTYRDLPNMLPHFFEELLNWIGDNEYQLITFAERVWPDDGVKTIRGQILISPKGMENLKVVTSNA